MVGSFSAKASAASSFEFQILKICLFKNAVYSNGPMEHKDTANDEGVFPREN